MTNSYLYFNRSGLGTSVYAVLALDLNANIIKSVFCHCYSTSNSAGIALYGSAEMKVTDCCFFDMYASPGTCGSAIYTHEGSGPKYLNRISFSQCYSEHGQAYGIFGGLGTSQLNNSAEEFTRLNRETGWHQSFISGNPAILTRNNVSYGNGIGYYIYSSGTGSSINYCIGVHSKTRNYDENEAIYLYSVYSGSHSHLVFHNITGALTFINTNSDHNLYFCDFSQCQFNRLSYSNPVTFFNCSFSQSIISNPGSAILHNSTYNLVNSGSNLPSNPEYYTCQILEVSFISMSCLQYDLFSFPIKRDIIMSTIVFMMVILE